MAENTPLYMDINNVYSGDEMGLPNRDTFTEGVVAATDLAVTAGAGNTVNVAAGAGWVTGDTDINRQPTYRVYNDAVVNKGITPDPTNPRYVRVVAQINDATFSGALRNWTITTIHGTPAVSPAIPALPASAMDLATILVPAAAASSAAYTITDTRVRAGIGANVPLGGGYKAYVPTWGATGTAPVLNNGTLTGRYITLGKFTQVWGILTMGSTTTFGTGAYVFGFPVGVLPNQSRAVGIFDGIDASSGARMFGVCEPQGGAAGAGAFAMVFPNTWPGGSGNSVSTTVPWTWAASDQIFWSLVYEAQ